MPLTRVRLTELKMVAGKEVSFYERAAAAGDAGAQNNFSMGELWRYATLCRVANVMRPYMESLS